MATRRKQARAHGRLMILGATCFTVLACGSEAPDTFKLPPTDTGLGGFDAVSLDGIYFDAGAANDATTADAASGGDDDGSADASPQDGAHGSPCKSNDDCDSNTCIDTPNGQRCAQPCVDSCAGDFVCKQLPGRDASYYCLPRWLHACEPCTTSSACQAPGFSGAACVDRGDSGGFCGTACDDSEDCPSGYTCALVTSVEDSQSQQCLPKSAATCACSERAKKLALTTTCNVKLDVGTCAGQRTCGPSGLTPCDAKPTKEACNGLDDDCNGKTDEGLCGDGNACTTDVCDPAKSGDGCSHTAAPGACDADDNACTEGDTCNDGVCKAGAVKSCDDNNPCTLDSCLPASGCTQTDNDGTACTDGDACTKTDVCTGGACVAGTLTVCKSGGFCVTAVCDKADGSCIETAKKEGTPCTDDNACTTKDSCVAGKCASTAVVCDDKNLCTTDSCHPVLGCQSTPNVQACDDGNPCTAADSCAAGLCNGKPIDAKTWCDDGNPCTTDSCNPQGGAGSPKAGCVHTNNQLACDDGSACSKGDVCTAGVCKAGVNVCQCTKDADCAAKEDGDLCNGTLFCDKSAAPYKCAVNPKTVVSCSKAGDTACKAAKCAPKTGKCALSATNEGKSCDADGSVCTVGDQCLAGSCKPGKTLGCDDGNPCTKDTCDGKQGCVTSKLSDKTSCGTAKWCIAGACVKGVSCGDGTVNQTEEQCDDGNNVSGDGCSKDCKKEAAIAPTTGDLIITEIMVNPNTTEQYGEWFEVYNTTKNAILLTGLQIGDGFGKELIKTTGLVLEPGGYFVFGSGDDLGGGGKANYVYAYAKSSIAFNNKGDSVTLSYGGQVIDTVKYGGKDWLAVPAGKTFQLSPKQMSATANNNGAAWCVATTAFGTKGAKGTPGKKNTDCP